MKNFVINKWYMLPILFGLSMFTMDIVGLFSLKTAHFFSYFVILFLIALLLSWVSLLINKQWRKCIYSVLISLLVVIIISIPFLLFD